MPAGWSRVQEMGRIPDDHLQAQLQCDEALRSRLEDMGLAVVTNTGANQNLCLIISMLQTADTSADDLVFRACMAQAELVSRPGALGEALREGQGLFADRNLFSELAAHLFDEDAIPPMLIMMAGERGVPVLFDPLRGPSGEGVDLGAVPHNTAILFESQGHFEAVANTSGRPWSIVLKQLFSAPGALEPDEAQLQHAVQATCSVGISSITLNKQIREHAWRRGVQTALELPRLNPPPTCLAKAREMAEAQAVVDEVWSALARNDVFELGQVSTADDGCQVHRLGLSPDDEYVALLPKDEQGAPVMPYVGERETAHQYVLELHIRKDWVTTLKVESVGEGDFVVRYDRPTQRSQRPRSKTSSTAAKSSTETKSHGPVLENPDHIAEMERVAEMKELPRYDLSRYLAFLVHLETGPCSLSQGKDIDTLKKFEDLPMADQNALVTQAMQGGLHSSLRQTINRVQQRQEDDRLMPPGGSALAHTGPRKRRPQPKSASHKAEMERIKSLPHLQKADPSAYASFLAYLETGSAKAPDGSLIDRLAKFEDRPLPEQNALVNAAVSNRDVTHSVRPAINRALDRNESNKLTPPGGGKYETDKRRERRTLPTNPEHLAEKESLRSRSDLIPSDPSDYSAFLAYLESGPSVQPGGPPIRTSAAFKSLPLDERNSLIDACIKDVLRSNTRQVVNRVQGWEGDLRLQPPKVRSRLGTGPMPGKPAPNDADHVAEMERVSRLGHASSRYVGWYSAFLAYLEKGPKVRPDEPAIKTLAAFNALKLSDQQLLLNVAVADGLAQLTCASINLVQGRPRERVLNAPDQGFLPPDQEVLTPYHDPGAPRYLAETPASIGFVTGEVHSEDDVDEGEGWEA